MSEPTPPRPRLDVRGAVDLSSLARPSTPAPGAPGGLPSPGPFVVNVDGATFADVVQSSSQYPVVVVLWAPWSEASQQVCKDLAAFADADAGSWLLARVDADANPQIAQAFQAPSVPAVIAVLAGRPLPLFQGAPSGPEMRDVLNQVLQAAAQAGITGKVAASTTQQNPSEPEEPPLPPLHQEAYDAFERDDLPGARSAYERALRENPRDAMARAGLAQVGLLERTRDVDRRTARTAAADAPGDVQAQLVVADLDVLGGNVEDAFARLIDVVRIAGPEVRETVRLRLVDLFDVVGSEDPRVVAARRALTNALY